MGKIYYLNKGRLDLSLLDAVHQKEKATPTLETSEETISLQTKLYKDEKIQEILKEMGEYFSKE